MSTYLYGKVLDFDKVNSNNRIYPKNEVLQAVAKFNTKAEKLSEVIPLSREVNINLDNVGAVCEELHIVDNSLYAQLRIIDSSKGVMLRTMLLEDNKAMLSLRGTVNPHFVENDVLEVTNLDIISIDVIPFDGYDESTVCQVQNSLTK